MVNVDAVSVRNNMIVDGDTLETVANLVPAVRVRPNNNALANTGTTQVYQHTVQNIGNGTDMFDLSAASSLSWTVQAVPSTLSLGEGLSATVEVWVTVPAGATGQTDVTTLTVTSQADASVSDMAFNQTTAINNAEISLSPNNAFAAAAEETVVYTHTLQNNASLSDTISLAATSSAGWAISLSDNSLTLGPGQTAEIQVSVTIPSGSNDGDLDLTTVTATSGNNAGVSDEAINVTTVDNAVVVSDLRLSPDNSTIAQPGDSVIYQHTLLNNGQATVTATLTAVSSLGWGVSVDPTATTLMAGESTVISVTVTVPATATNSSVNLTTVTATSVDDAMVTDDALNVTTISANAPATGATLLPNNSSTVLVGESVVYTHTLTNQGDSTDVFTLSSVSDQGWSISLSNNLLALAAGGSATINVTVNAPASGPNGLVDITTVYALSQNQGGVLVAVASDVSTLLNPASVSLSPNQSSQANAGSTVQYTYVLTNDGASIDTFSLGANSSQGWTVAVNEPEVTLEPGASTSVQLTLTVPPSATQGITDTSTLTAVSAFGPAAQASATSVTTIGTAGPRNLFLPIVLK
jgi:uncharacterized membrane protein